MRRLVADVLSVLRVVAFNDDKVLKPAIGRLGGGQIKNGSGFMDSTTDERAVFRCKKCGRIIGIMVDGRRRIQIDGLMFYRLHGECECGEQVYWDSSDVMSRRLMKDLK